MSVLFERIRPPEDFPSGINRERLMLQLSEMGLSSRDTLLVHSSLRALGDIEGGAGTVIDALCGCLSQGTLLLPVFTYKTVNGGHNVFDPGTEPSCAGILGEVLLQRVPGSVRTRHPEYSMAIWGAGARSVAERDEEYSSPCPRFGCLGALSDGGGYVLLAGTGMESCLPVFAAGEWLEPEKWLAPPEIRYTVDKSGSVVMCSSSGYRPEIISSAKYFKKLAAPLEELGAARRCRFGNADCLLFRCAKLVSIVSNLLFRNPELFADRKPVSRRLLKAVAADEETLERRRMGCE